MSGRQTLTAFSDDVIDQYVALGAWGETTWGEVFDKLVERDPNRVAIVDDANRMALTGMPPERLNYQELSARIDVLAQLFARAGLGQGDVVLTQLPNIWEAVALILMAARTGIIISPVPMQYRQKELADIIANAAPKAAVTVGSFKGHEHGQMLVDLLGTETPVYVIGEAIAGTPLEVDPATKAPHAPPVGGPNDILTLCWTSGTENEPKAVPRTHNNWFTTARGIIIGAQLPEGCVFLNPFPVVNMASIAGQLFPAIYLGGTHVLHHPFDMPNFLHQIETEKINYTVVAPALLGRMAKDPEMLANTDLSSLVGLGSGSAPLDPWVVRVFQDQFGIPITNFFGSNEGVSLTSGTLDIPDPEHRATLFPRAGRSDLTWKNPAMNWSETRLVDPDTNEEITETAVPGEFQIRGPSIFPGYFRGGKLVVQGFTEDGFFRSGDLFELAELDGKQQFYRFNGRLREIIIRGGMNISPVEIDTLLSRHPDLTDAAVAGYSDPDLGERVCAFVVPKPGMTFTLEDLGAYLSQSGLAKFKWPERLEILDALPRNSLNKVVRRKLSELVEKPE